jgi:hypothetical protein
MKQQIKPPLAELARLNAGWLRQAENLLEEIREEEFGAEALGLRVASQMRHVIEFYECFLDGLESSHVDYGARRRDVSVEACRGAASARLRMLAGRLETVAASEADRVLFVRLEDADFGCGADDYAVSSVVRELSVLSSHAVHHFALMAAALRAQGFEPDSEFGVAPSTLRYRKGQRREAA